MKLNTKTKTLNMYDSESKGNVIIFRFKTSDYTLEELKAIFSNKEDIVTLYKLTDDGIFVTTFDNYTEIISVATSKITITDYIDNSIVVDGTETTVQVPAEKEIPMYEFYLRYVDPLKAIVDQNRADIDFLALMTGNEL